MAIESVNPTLDGKDSTAPRQFAGSGLSYLNTQCDDLPERVKVHPRMFARQDAAFYGMSTIANLLLLDADPSPGCGEPVPLFDNNRRTGLLYALSSLIDGEQSRIEELICAQRILQAESQIERAEAQARLDAIVPDPTIREILREAGMRPDAPGWLHAAAVRADEYEASHRHYAAQSKVTP